MDVIYRIYQNVLYIENVTGFHGRRVDIVPFTRIWKVKPRPFFSVSF